jgi:hypothetical protein
MNDLIVLETIRMMNNRFTMNVLAPKLNKSIE